MLIVRVGVGVGAEYEAEESGWRDGTSQPRPSVTRTRRIPVLAHLLPLTLDHSSARID